MDIDQETIHPGQRELSHGIVSSWRLASDANQHLGLQKPSQIWQKVAAIDGAHVDLSPIVSTAILGPGGRNHRYSESEEWNRVIGFLAGLGELTTCHPHGRG